MFENVVVGVGATDEARGDAIALAMQLVSPRGRLTLVHVLVVAAKPAPDSGSHQAAAKHRRVVDELTDLAQRLCPAARVSCVEASSVRRGLHQFATAERGDLLVVGASRSDEVAQLLLGDDTVDVLEGAPCPVAVAPAGYAARAATISRIGVAYDGSTESEQAVRLAMSMASERGAELSALGDVEADAEYGVPADELAGYAQTVDLMVIGAHKYRPIDRLTQQTTSQQLAGRTPSPLLVLSANGRARG